MQKKPKKHSTLLNIFLLIIISIFSFEIYNHYIKKEEIIEHETIQYNTLIDLINDKQISKVIITEKALEPKHLLVTKLDDTEVQLLIPTESSIINRLEEQNIDTEVVLAKKPSTILKDLLLLLPTLLFLVFLILMIKNLKGKGGILGLGKSNSTIINPEDIKTGFDDVIGCDNAKQEAKEFIDFFKNPEKFSKVGARIPRGLLLSGPAGTGKTLLAKALAKESGVSFISLSGSDFIEMFAGLGAARVRDLFSTAKKNAPCLIFIDEIDAIGAKRGNSGISNGSSTEHEQTLNQILVELDGFNTDSNVILVAATNRPEILDPALLRAGRIDRQITLSLPDVKGRSDILSLYTKDKPIDTTVDLMQIARGTPGFSGASLSNLVNEAAIFAARRQSALLSKMDFEQAKDKLIMGIEHNLSIMTNEEKLDTAYHEAGHAVIAALLPNADPVYKVTIIPRGQSLGSTIQLPEKDRTLYKKEYLINKMAILMGGREAELLFCNTLTTGASNDILVATNIAKRMVTEWGMSELGPVAFYENQSSHLQHNHSSSWFKSESLNSKIEFAIQKLLQQASTKAQDILSENQEKVHLMAQALMEIETLEEKQIKNIMNGRPFDCMGS